VSVGARSRALDRRFYGVAEALVVDVDDPAQEGRVKVKFPWFDDDTVSDWCRVRQLYAGNGYGTFFVPEVGDEVLVAFVHGDMRLPVILGGLYNGQDKPATHRDSSTDQKLVRTRGGHELLLDDTDGQKRVRLRSDAGHELDLDDQGQKVRLRTAGGIQVELDDAAGKVTVQTASGQSLVLEASGAATLTATTVTVSAQSIDLGQGASQPLVLGTSMMTLFNAHVHTCTAPGAPSSPPLTPMTPAQLSLIAKTS
jgi:phage baseplate assembly protein V